MAITLGGGGGSASQINEVVSLRNDATTVTLADARVYLKGGIFETDLTVYPNASNSFQYTGTNFSVASQDTSPSGITWDGTYLWVVGYGSDSAYKYNTSGTYQSVSFSIASQDSSPEDIAWDGTSFWVLGGNTDTVYKYNASGVYQNVSFSVASEESSPEGIAWDGTSLWVVGTVIRNASKYEPVNGVASDASFGGQNYVRVV